MDSRGNYVNCSADAFCTVSTNGRDLLNCVCRDGFLGSGVVCRGKQKL